MGCIGIPLFPARDYGPFCVTLLLCVISILNLPGAEQLAVFSVLECKQTAWAQQCLSWSSKYLSWIWLTQEGTWWVKMPRMCLAVPHHNKLYIVWQSMENVLEDHICFVAKMAGQIPQAPSSTFFCPPSQPLILEPVLEWAGWSPSKSKTHSIERE